MSAALDRQGRGPHLRRGETFRIRAATMDDAPEIRDIRNAAVRESLAIWTSIEQDPEAAEDWLRPMVERGTALIAEDRSGGSRALGFAVASPWHAYEGYARTVEDSIYLRRQAQGRGLGAGLLTALLQASLAAGDRTMVALIEAGNAASLRLHKSHGFDVVGTIPQAGEKLGRVLDLTLMSRALARPTTCS